MTEVAARSGYGGASVSRVLERAGISRATFYQCFRDREECFSLACAGAEACLLGTLGRAGGGEPALYPRHLLAELLAATEAAPDAAGLLMLEARGASASTRARREGLQARIEASVLAGLNRRRAATGQGPWIPARALVGGVENVLAARVHRGEAARVCRLLFDLLDWVGSYELAGEAALPPGWRVPAGGRHAPSWSAGAPGPPPRLPRGRSALAGDLAADDRRERVLVAVSALSRERGYEAITVGDLVARARVSRAAFYRLYGSKEDAFLAAQTASLQRSIALAAEAFFGAESWPEKVWRGLEALLAYVASQPDLAWAGIVDNFAAGRAAIGRAIETRGAFALFLEEGYALTPRARRLPRLCSEAVGGAILELLRAEILARRCQGSLRLLPTAAYVALAPFMGAAEARGFVEARVRGPGEGAATRPARRAPRSPG
jgi:AcrR family transcriptional regulator